MTKAEETKLLKEWQHRLGLDDWEIYFETDVDPDDMQIENSVGCTSWTESTKAATIQIATEESCEDNIRPFDLEKTLIHELLHLKMTLLGYDVPKLQERIVHMIIDDLARAFVDAKRSK